MDSRPCGRGRRHTAAVAATAAVVGTGMWGYLGWG